MTRRLKYSCCLLVSMSGILSYIHGQEFKFSATIDAITAMGFYRLHVTPQLSALARADYADIRIAGPGGNFIPYIVRTEQPQTVATAGTSSLKILSNNSDSLYTTVTLQQPNDRWTFGLSIAITATSVERYAEISGSKDNKHWYIIDDNILLRWADGYTKGSYAQTISFPGNKYAYYKLKINNAHTDPLNITGAYAFHDSVQVTMKPNLLQNPRPVISQKDSSNHISYVVLRNTLPFMVNELSLEIEGPKFFDRSARVYVLPSDRDSGSLYYPIATVNLTSGKPSYYQLPGQKAQAILMEINNGDNPPLEIVGAATRQQSKALVAWLEQGKAYSLLAGNDRSVAPQYDLARFNDSIPGQLPEIVYGIFSATQPTVVEPTKLKKNGYLLWVIIVASVIVLSFLTYGLMKDVKQ